MRLLDLFCGAGGSAMGFHRAGFTEIIGVDSKPQPNYPFTFVQDDALDYLEGVLEDSEQMSWFTAFHAAPPCHDHSMLRNSAGLDGTGWLLYATLERFQNQSKPWVIENVVGANLPTAIELCGATFGLGASGMDLPRHRRFECSFPILAPPCSHRRGHTMGVYGHGTNAWHRKKLGRNLTVAEMREAMEIDWMTRDELTQAIPPAYTEFIGSQLLEQLKARPS